MIVSYQQLSKHLAGWAVFIAYEVSFARFTAGRFAPSASYIFYYGLNIALFYSHAYLLSRTTYLLAAALVLPELLFYLAIKYLLDRGLFPTMTGTVYLRTLLVPNLYRGISFIGYSTLYWSILRMLEIKTARLTTLKEKAEVERNLAEAMNAYLQQQLNPHLLFNTLTFIYNRYYPYSPEASRCVLLLVDIMRFSLEDVPNGKIALDREVEQIQNFIELNQLRFDYTLCLDTQLEGDFETPQIIPLVLLTLTENIFKHGYLKDPAAPAKLVITVTANNELHFSSWNLKSHQPANRRLRSIGLRNVIKRLEYSYNDHYTLAISDEPNSYGLDLTLRL